MRNFILRLYTKFYTIFVNKNIKIGFNSLVSKKFLKRINKNYKEIYIENSIITDNVLISEGVKVYKSCEINGHVEIGRYTSINGPSTRIQGNIEGVKIGNFCSIGSNVVIQEDYHNYNRATSYLIYRNIINTCSTNEFYSKGKIIIEDDVWIGSNSVILSGITIGRGAVIGAGSVITKNVPPYSIVAGNPAKVIKLRFSSERINELEDSQWWTWSKEEIIKNDSFFNKTLT